VKLSEVFRRARAHLAYHGRGYACIVLEHELGLDPEVANEAIAIVRKCINGCYTADEYVARQLGWTGEETGFEITEVVREGGINMNEWRQTFLEGLAVQFEAQGN
jgi:hypothetical protein